MLEAPNSTQTNTAQDISGRLEAVFRNIQAERMEGVPILNSRLEVEAIGMQDWNGLWLSVLVTPWFINLMLLPKTEEHAEGWGKLGLGSSAPYRFPAGRFDFLVGEENGLGRFQMCSLFSPVLEFENHEAAQVAARAALEAIFNADIDGNEEKDRNAAPADRPDGPAVHTPSRRGLLMGKIGHDGDPA